MSSKVHIHPTTGAELNSMSHSPPQTLLLFGRTGVGLRTVAWDFALGVTPEAYVSEVAPDDKGTITIDTVRSLYRQTRSKQNERRVVIIDDVDAMSIPAQNAFLKLLEEPVSGVLFLLTSHQPTALLPTILSRLQKVEVRPLPSDLTLSIISGFTDDTKLSAQLMFMAGGLPAELDRLMSNEKYLESKTGVAEKTKRFVGMDRTQKLLFINTLAGSRDDARQFIDMLLGMLKLQLKKQQDEPLLEYMDVLLSVNDSLKNNGHVRTQLLRTVV